MEILIISDDEKLLKNLTTWLQERYPQAVIKIIEDGDKGFDQVKDYKPSLVIVVTSIFSDDSDMRDFIDNARNSWQCPLYFLVEEDSETKRVQAIEMGADECMSLPLKPLEFLARVGALLRNVSRDSFSEKKREVSLGDNLVINLESGTVLRGNKEILLTKSEIRLLFLLINNEGKMVNSEILKRNVWGKDFLDDPNILKQHIYQLRAKIEDDPHNPKIITNRRGFGYTFMRR